MTRRKSLIIRALIVAVLFCAEEKAPCPIGSSADWHTEECRMIYMAGYQEYPFNDKLLEE